MARITGTIPVNIFLDVERFQVAIDRLNTRVSDAASSASLKAAKEIAKAVKAKLETYPHPHDPNAISPAPPFKGPVGSLTTGHGAHIRPWHLRDSVTVEDQPYIHSAKVFPTAIYARIQELGGWTGNSRTLYAHTDYVNGIPLVSGPYKSGSHHIYLPPRPYFRPTVMEMGSVGSFRLEKIYYEEWRDAMLRAIAF